jgi:hypothetical protein
MVSRLLTELRYKVIVAHAQKVQLITKSNRKDDRHDARTLARLARIDPELLGPRVLKSVPCFVKWFIIIAYLRVLSPARLLCRIPQESTKTQCLCGYFAFR